MHRFHAPELSQQAGPVLLTGAEAVHAAQVLRVRRDEAVMLLNGRGLSVRARVVSTSRKQVELEPVESQLTPPPPCPITLFQAITRPRSMEVIVQKATELGAAVIQPVISEHVVTRLDDEDATRKVEKWQRTAVEAMKQCGVPWLPEVRTPRSLHELAAAHSSEAEWFLGSLLESARWLRAWTTEWQRSLPTGVGLWIGPEGDFSNGELRLLEESGAKPFTMGGNVLRSETAAICAVAVLVYELALATQPTPAR